jgi:hypothetical protein
MNQKSAPTEGDLGSKVSIRLHEPDGSYRDLLGTLLSLDSIERKDGVVLKFDPAQIFIWKVVPEGTTMKRKP